MLCTRGVDPHQLRLIGEMPIYQAVRRGYTETVACLLDQSYQDIPNNLNHRSVVQYICNKRERVAMKTVLAAGLRIMRIEKEQLIAWWKKTHDIALMHLFLISGITIPVSLIHGHKLHTIYQKIADNMDQMLVPLLGTRLLTDAITNSG